jgi:hypothetical protein
MFPVYVYNIKNIEIVIRFVPPEITEYIPKIINGDTVTMHANIIAL